MVDPEGNHSFEHGGEKYTAVFNFRAMKEVERHYDKPFFLAIQAAVPTVSAEDAGDPAKLQAAMLRLRLTDVGVLLRCALLKHHPDLTEDDVDDLIDGIGLKKAGEVIGSVISAAIVEEGDSGSKTNPPRAPRKK